MIPFLLTPSGKDYVWGGTRLRDEFHKILDVEPLAETWECSTHPDGPCFVASGPFKGQTLTSLLHENPSLLGTSLSGVTDLPILIKFIDARENLSVQVHPDDEFALECENGQLGKTEMWYVVDAEPGAELLFGLSRRLTVEQLRNYISEGKLERYLHHVPVRKNDVFYIPSGTIHAIGKGALIAEIQQSSNLTYRLYDYNRVDKNGRLRELHVEKALQVSRLDVMQDPRQPMRVLRYSPGFASEQLCQCKYFQVSRCLLNSATGILLPALPVSFRALICISGDGALSSDDFSLSYKKGDCVFIPATCDNLYMTGTATFLLTRC